jgi:hypothetical protein
MNSLRFQPRVVHVPEPLIEFGMGLAGDNYLGRSTTTILAG